jgi:hypothetical protein
VTGSGHGSGCLDCCSDRLLRSLDEVGVRFCARCLSVMAGL